MSLVLRTSERMREFPKPQVISVGGVECGECRPNIDTYNELRWHAVIRLNTKSGSAQRLVQGFGASPEKAVADAVLDFRVGIAETLEQFAWLEQELGTAGRSEGEIRRSFGLGDA